MLIHRNTVKKIKRRKRNLAHLNQACLLKTQSVRKKKKEKTQSVASYVTGTPCPVTCPTATALGLPRTLPPYFLNRKQNRLFYYLLLTRIINYLVSSRVRLEALVINPFK